MDEYYHYGHFTLVPKPETDPKEVVEILEAMEQVADLADGGIVDGKLEMYSVEVKGGWIDKILAKNAHLFEDSEIIWVQGDFEPYARIKDGKLQSAPAIITAGEWCDVEPDPR